IFSINHLHRRIISFFNSSSSSLSLTLSLSLLLFSVSDALISCNHVLNASSYSAYCAQSIQSAGNGQEEDNTEAEKDCSSVHSAEAKEAACIATSASATSANSVNKHFFIISLFS